MTGPRSRPAGRRLLVVLALLLALTAGAAPASAHTSDPRLLTTLDEVTPALPDEVVVQVQASLAAQLVADNPTDTPLEVLGLDGRPFLRLSAAGVQADVAHPDFLTTSTPSGAAPPSSDGARTARWVQISSGTSWGWFDHRLHPGDLEPPDDVRQRIRLSTWAVPLRYGDAEVEARGAVDLEPLLGAFVVTAEAAPEPLLVQALPGRLPGLFLANPERRPLTVLGRDGEPFLRFGPAGVEVNTASRTHVEDRRARGEPADPPAPTPRFEVVDPQGTSYTWLDARLRYPADLPPPAVLAAGQPSVLMQWRVPVEGLAGTAALTGDIRWQPEQGAVARSADGGGAAVPPAALAALAVAVAGGAAFALRRRRG